MDVVDVDKKGEDSVERVDLNFVAAGAASEF